MSSRPAKRTDARRRASTQPFTFVAMPFGRKFDPIYEEVIKPALEEIGCRVERADEIYRSSPIIKDIEEDIKESDIMVADLTGRNPNVLYEVGFARAARTSLVLITRKMNDVPFDLQHRRCFRYKTSFQGRNELVEKLKRAAKVTWDARGHGED